MNIKLYFLALLFISTKTLGQTGDVEIVNNTNCRMTVTLFATDPSVSAGCDYIGNQIVVNAGTTWGPFDMCTVESMIGWLSAPTPLPCSPPTWPASFVWTGASARFVPCNILMPPFYTAAGTAGMVEDMAPTGTCGGSSGTSYTFPTGQTLQFTITSGTAPLHIQILDF